MSANHHFWQGEWINDGELERRVSNLDQWIASELEKEPQILPVLQASDALAKELLQDQPSPAAERLTHCLVESGLATHTEAQQALKEMAAFLKRQALEFKLKRELGSLRPFVDARVNYEDTVFEAWSPLGFLVHVSPQNAFTVGPMSVLEGLLSGNVNFLKTGGNESLFPQLFLNELCSLDPSGWIANRVIAAKISSKRKDLLERIFAQCDGIAAWGGEESAQAIRQSAPAGTRVVEWGHKISFIYVTPSACTEECLELIARECCSLEQQACSSPQCVYLDTKNWEELEKFGQRLADSLQRVSPQIQQTPPSDSEAAEISLITECQRLEACYGGARVIAAADSSWRVLLDHRSPLQASPLFRTVWVKPLPKAKIISVLRPMRKYLQTAGVACEASDVHLLAQHLRAAGVERVRRVGEMLASYSGEPHDGVYALQRYCRRTSVQLHTELANLSSFQELRGDEPLHFDTLTPVTSKDSFTDIPEDPGRSRLYFKSGGSSGEPKLSTYDYDQYREQMRLGADGLVAAGFDPLSDRAMNLFFSGGLYGSFLSIFSTLEVLEAVQFPMAAHPDHAMVAKTIVKNGVNTLLGMPSYLLQLFESQAQTLGSYGKIKKIFYGGEHFSEAQTRYLRERFGVELIRSLAYGTVDIGPIGYQCRFCEGGVHHLHHGVQYLEILKMDEDRPVHGTEVGRLVFSPRSPFSNKPMRYEIGDVGQWIGTPGQACACGRRAPKFKLLGRTGDIFRIGATFLNYQKISQILSIHENYSGEIQLVLECGETDGLKERLTLLIAQKEGIDLPRLRDACLANYHDLQEAVLEDKTLLFEVRTVASEKMERTPGSGKLRHILDRRVRA